MAMIDQFDVDKKIIAAFRADTAVEGLLGADANLRLFTRTPTATTIFPWTRMETIPSGPPPTGTMTGSGIEWVLTVTKQFTTFSNSTSLDTVSAVMKAIYDVMNRAPTKITLTTGTIFNTIPKNQFAVYDVDTQSTMSVTEHELWISSG